MLMRKVMQPFEYKAGRRVAPGQMVGVSPAVSNRDAGATSPTRALRPEPLRAAAARRTSSAFAWIPFGAGRHRCVGAAFAMMQLKAIFSCCCAATSFELAQPPESYRNDHSKMVVQLAQPCRVRYRRAAPEAPRSEPKASEVHRDAVRSGVRQPRASSSTSTSARATASARARRPRSSGRPEDEQGRDPRSDPPPNSTQARRERRCPTKASVQHSPHCAGSLAPSGRPTAAGPHPARTTKRSTACPPSRAPSSRR